jgi:hypothetical protein
MTVLVCLADMNLGLYPGPVYVWCEAGPVSMTLNVPLCLANIRKRVKY